MASAGCLSSPGAHAARRRAGRCVRTYGLAHELDRERGELARRTRRGRAEEELLAPDPFDVLAALAGGQLEPGEADDVVPAVGACAAGVVPDRHGHGDLVVDVVRAVGARLVARDAADPIRVGIARYRGAAAEA